MKIIMRTIIILAVALLVVGITFAANQAGLFQNIASGRTEHAEFNMPLDGSAAGTQTHIRPERPGHMRGQDGERGMGRDGEGGAGGFGALMEIIKSLGIVIVIVAVFAIGQRLWLAMRGSRDRHSSGAVG